jgi:hypothetical protein
MRWVQKMKLINLPNGVPHGPPLILSSSPETKLLDGHECTTEPAVVATPSLTNI